MLSHFSCYLMKPEAHGKRALQELLEAQWAQAEDAYRKAFKLNPKDRQYVDLIQDTMKRVKR